MFGAIEPGIVISGTGSRHVLGGCASVGRVAGAAIAARSRTVGEFQSVSVPDREGSLQSSRRAVPRVGSSGFRANRSRLPEGENGLAARSSNSTCNAAYARRPAPIRELEAIAVLGPAAFQRGE